MRAQLKFPIFSFNPNNNVIYVCWSAKIYKTTDVKWLKNHNRRGYIVVDSIGIKYIIKQAYMVRWKGIHGFTGMNCNMIEVENEYEERIQKISLYQLQEMIMERYPKSNEFHSQCWENTDDFKDKLFQCQTFEEVAELFRCRPSKNFFLKIWRGY